MEMLHNGEGMGSLLRALQQRNDLLGELVAVLQQLCDPQVAGDITALEALVERQAALMETLTALADAAPLAGEEGSDDAAAAAAREQSLRLLEHLAVAAVRAGAVIAGRLTYLRAEAAYVDRLLAPAEAYQAAGAARRAGAAAAAVAAAKA